MRTVVVGLGHQGRRRLKTAAQDAVFSVDPVAEDAAFRDIRAVPLEDFDSALVATPDGAKYEIVRYLLSHGKHVLVEKPLLAPEPMRLEELKRLSETMGAACYTAYNHRFEPLVEKLQRILGQGRIGRVYRARFFYGNGTARDVKEARWRDEGLGVVADLGSHLIDLVGFLFGGRDFRFEAVELNRFENEASDHALLISRGEPKIQLEMSYLSWKNSFTIDIWGREGSVHMDGLCKWGPSRLELRKRVFPSGRPLEEAETVQGEDPTWEKEYANFKRLSRGENYIANDIWIQSSLATIQETVVGGLPL